MAGPTLPNTWIIQDGRTITRPQGMSDRLWRDTLESGGWTPGATGAGTAPGADPEQVMGFITQALAAGGTIFSTIFGAITAANAQTGLITLSDGRQMTVAQLEGMLTISGNNELPPVTFDTSEPPPTQGFEVTPMVLLAIGGLGLVLLVALRK